MVGQRNWLEGFELLSIQAGLTARGQIFFAAIMTAGEAGCLLTEKDAASVQLLDICLHQPLAVEAVWALTMLC